MWLQIALAFLANWIVGCLWYTPWTFMNAIADLKAQKTHRMGWTHVAGVTIFGLMEAFGLYYAISIMKARTLVAGAKLGYLCWQFFVCPTICVHYVFNGRPIKEMLVIAGHHLVSFILEGAAIGYFA